MVDIRFEVNIDPTIVSLKRQMNELPGIIADSTDEIGRKGERLFQGLTGPWKHNVNFRVETKKFNTGAETELSSDDKPLHFLDKGTRVRRALMSPDWISKTTPNSMRSGPGRGRVLFISRRLALPGIKARNFSKVTARMLSKDAPGIINRHLAKLFR